MGIFLLNSVKYNHRIFCLRYMLAERDVHLSSIAFVTYLLLTVLILTPFALLHCPLFIYVDPSLPCFACRVCCRYV